MRKVLIANRGEIALRVIRTCREMGLKTVAVYSSADRDTLHVKYADEAVCIGSAPSSDSYLRPNRIIAAAEITGADAIHPGYGFLAENALFSAICSDHGIKFIGPPPHTITLMGDKSRAKETMREAGVPVVPGSEGIVETVHDAGRLATEMEYPVLIKASAGGGGRGMRIVRNEAELEQQFHAARSEAEAAFGSDEVYVEKLVEGPRHIEIQVFSDAHGNTFHMGERECSIQRRHQKLLEEAPSPAVDATLREKMGEAAVLGTASVDYEGAGTVEFLLDKHGEFYFMEMNTRIQVEHPVTEEVTGQDLIELQIRAAMGERLQRFSGRPVGHAIECRLNAEDPYRGFQPCPGTVTSFHPPGGLGVRVDTHAYAGYTIPPHYDSMIGKLIVHARNRELAIRKMQRAVDEFVLEGVETTLPFFRELLSNPAFGRGDFTTQFVDNLQLAA